MFATLRYDQNSTLVQQADYIMACTNCRARKLKCTGQKDGCNRCLSRGAECKYPEPAQGRGSRKARGTLNKTNKALNTSASSSRSSVQSPSVSKTPKSLASPKTSHDRYGSKPVSNGTSSVPSPVPSLSWTGSLSSDTNDTLLFDSPIISDVLMNEAADEFGNEFQLGNPDIFGFDNHPSSDLMWTNFLESVGQQSEEPSSLSSPESIHFDGLSNVDHTTNNLFGLQSPPSSSSTSLSLCKPIEASKQAGNFEEDQAVVSLNDVTPPIANPKDLSGNPRQTTSDFFTGQITEPSSPPPSPLSQLSCQCFTTALSLLEALTLGDTKSYPPTIASRLHMKKRALVQCNKLLDCPHCSGTSSFMVLLLVICEKMVLSYEQVLILLTGQYDRIRQQPHSKQIPPSLNSRAEASLLMQNEERQMTVKDYDIDPDEEPCVFGGLALTQLKRLRDFLSRIKTVLKSWSWDSHLAMLEAIESRVRNQLRLYGKRSDE